MTRRHVLVLQHIACEGPGAIELALAARQIGMRTVRADAGEPVPHTLDGALGIVVMGGPMGVYETGRFAHIGHELRLLEVALRNEVPILGICLGSQLLAAALGARVYPLGRKEIGWYEVRLNDAARADPLWCDAPERFTPLHWHGDIFDLPAGAVPLASSAMTDVQAYRYGRSAYGLLFHLEVTQPQVEEWVRIFQPELASAKLPAEPILSGIGTHLAEANAVGERCFGRWAERVAARAVD